jgi:hypothetical protein
LCPLRPLGPDVVSAAALFGCGPKGVM